MPPAPLQVASFVKTAKIVASMNKKSKIIKITVCGPGDVGKEVEITREVISAWNQQNWEATGWGLKVQHWNTDSAPTMAERGQAAINHKLIDDSDIIVAILWTRLGTPTGLAGSGTEEEITRAIAREIRVMPYFSDLEAPGSHIDAKQFKRLEAFRAKVTNMGLPFSFNSRRKFREMFENHLDIAVREILLSLKARKKPTPEKKTISQKAVGNSNTQVAGDNNTFIFKSSSPKRPKVTIARSPDHISPADQKQVSDWIKDLAEESTGKSLSLLIAEWWSRFYNRFKLASYKELLIHQMPEVKAWHRQQINLLKADRKTTDPQSWKNSKYSSIKSKMGKMSRTKDEYYPELSSRLNMKKAFTSLTKLSKHDLERVNRLVEYDFKKWTS